MHSRVVVVVVEDDLDVDVDVGVTVLAVVVVVEVQVHGTCCLISSQICVANSSGSVPLSSHCSVDKRSGA